jgi:V8-like Glu-specific endopeptidase
MSTQRHVGVDDTVAISFFAEGARVARAVCCIARPEAPATAFLIADDLIVTNNHVFPDETSAKSVSVRFNYQRGLDGRLLRWEEYALGPATYFHTNDQLDYTIVAVEGAPGVKWGNVELFAGEAALRSGSDVIIVEHPQGEPKRLAIVQNTITAIDPPHVKYTADTDIGSSGSPVFDVQWRLIAVNRWGSPTENEGVLASAIAEDWPGRPER